MQMKFSYLCIIALVMLIRLTTWFCDGYDRVQPLLPLVINTWAFKDANAMAWKMLHQSKGNKALDALVEGLSTCERLQCDGTVGYGGSPDENGETTLDALLFDGNSMNIGAVAGLRNIKHAAKVARHVLENTKHSMLVGDAATDFAVMMGFKREQLATPESIEKFAKWKRNKCQPNFWTNVCPDPLAQCGPYKPLTEATANRDKERQRYNFGFGNHDTIGMIVIGDKGQVLAGTSTNGASHKIPGRVGDSPIPGAGAFADKDVGAAVATGDGDIMMRFAPSALTIEFMRMGMLPKEATETAIQRILQYYPEFSGAIVAADRHGKHSAACAGMEHFPYSIVQGDATQKTRLEYVKCIQPENIDDKTKAPYLSVRNKPETRKVATYQDESKSDDATSSTRGYTNEDEINIPQTDEISKSRKAATTADTTITDAYVKLKDDLTQLHLRIKTAEKALNDINMTIQNSRIDAKSRVSDKVPRNPSCNGKSWYDLTRHEKLERINKEMLELSALSQQTKNKIRQDENQLGETLSAFKREFLEHKELGKHMQKPSEITNDAGEEKDFPLSQFSNRFARGSQGHSKDHPYKKNLQVTHKSRPKILCGSVIPTKIILDNDEKKS